MSNVTTATKSVALKGSVLSIRPYLDGKPNMGLETWGSVLVDGAMQRDDLACDTSSEINTYLTGLNEMAPEVQKMADKEEKKNKIKEIRQVVAWLENVEGGNYTVRPETCMANYDTPEKDDFWSHVKTFNSIQANQYDSKGMRILNYFDKVQLELNNNGMVLDEDIPRHKIIAYAIDAGGFALVAKSLDHAESTGAYKFYLDKRADTAALRTSPMKNRDKAGGVLSNMMEKDFNRLFYVAKLISPDSLQYKTGKNATPNDIFYEDCYNYMEGKGKEKVKSRAVEEFLSYAALSMDDLILRTIVRDASLLRLISVKSDGHLYYIKTDTLMGKTVGDVVAWLKSPLNEQIKSELSDIVKEQWSN